jgi:hypothetical protein
VACSHDAGAAAAAGREIVVTDGDKTLAKAPLPATLPGDATLILPGEPAAGARLVARLSGAADAIATDDVAPIVTEAGPGALAVVSDATEAPSATGGAPVVEQALAALRSGVAVRPLPILPDGPEDLGGFVGVIADDPPGFTPEQRHALATYLGDGGLLLLALGARSAVAPLGASFEPVLDHPVAFEVNDVAGADPPSARGDLGEAAATLLDLGASRRTVLAPEDTSSLETLIAWNDKRPLVARRAIARGEAWIVTLPFNVDASDLPLRPGFLSLLSAWVDKARLRASPRRGEVGVPWVFAAGGVASVQGPTGPVQVARDESGAAERVEPPVVGAYDVKLAGNKTELRVAAPALREIDFRPRAVVPAAAGKSLGNTHASVDVSWAVALFLLALVALELALRVRAAAATPTSPALP